MLRNTYDSKSQKVEAFLPSRQFDATQKGICYHIIIQFVGTGHICPINGVYPEGKTTKGTPQRSTLRSTFKKHQYFLKCSLNPLRLKFCETASSRLKTR